MLSRQPSTRRDMFVNSRVCLQTWTVVGAYPRGCRGLADESGVAEDVFKAGRRLAPEDLGRVDEFAFDRVVAGAQLVAGDLGVERDDDVMHWLEAFAVARYPSDLDLESRLLADLALRRLAQGLAGFDAAAGQRPIPLE